MRIKKKSPWGKQGRHKIDGITMGGQARYDVYNLHQLKQDVKQFFPLYLAGLITETTFTRGKSSMVDRLILAAERSGS